MSNDPLIRNALSTMSKMEAFVELNMQIDGSARYQPMVVILRKAMAESAEAMVGLTTAPANDPEKIRTLQMKACAFDDLVRWTKEIISDAKAADANQTQADRDALLKYLVDSDQESRARDLGLFDDEE